MAMALKHLGFVFIGFMAGALSVQALHAQGGTNRDELRKVDLTGTSGTEVIMATLDIPPGATVPRHFHNGDEFLYVLEGGSFQAAGQDPATFDAGMTLHFPRKMPHGGFTVVGDKTLKVLTVHVVDKGKPLVELIKWHGGARCPTCASHSRAYVQHLFCADEMLGPILLTRHNLHYYQDLMAGLRAAIETGTLADFAAGFEAEQARGIGRTLK